MSINAIAKSSNGIEVFEHPTSHIHINKDLAAEVIGKLTLDGGYHFETIDMGRIIGKDHLVETDSWSSIFYAARPYSYDPLKIRNGESRLTWDDAEDTQFITVGLCVDSDPDELQGKWCIFTIFEGKPGEKEPWDNAFKDGKNPEGLKKATEFWKGAGEKKEHAHALSCTEREREYFVQLAKDNDEFFKKLYKAIPYEIKEMMIDENLDDRLGLKAHSSVSQMVAELDKEYDSWWQLNSDVQECCEEYYYNSDRIDQYYYE